MPTKEQCSICGVAHVNGKPCCNCNAGPLQPLSLNERSEWAAAEFLSEFTMEHDGRPPAAMETFQAGVEWAANTQKQWRCFFCDDVFTTQIDAENHFGRY